MRTSRVILLVWSACALGWKLAATQPSAPVRTPVCESDTIVTLLVGVAGGNEQEIVLAPRIQVNGCAQP